MFQFHLKHLLTAVTCFAVSFATLPRVSIDKNINTLALLVIGVAAIGGGMGALLNRFQQGVAIGMLIAIASPALSRHGLLPSTAGFFNAGMLLARFARTAESMQSKTEYCSPQ